MNTSNCSLPSPPDAAVDSQVRQATFAAALLAMSLLAALPATWALRLVAFHPIPVAVAAPGYLLMVAYFVAVCGDGLPPWLWRMAAVYHVSLAGAALISVGAGAGAAIPSLALWSGLCGILAWSAAGVARPPFPSARPSKEMGPQRNTEVRQVRAFEAKGW